MANRITTLFTFKEDGTGLAKVKADVSDADGALNKFKTGAKSTFTEFRTQAAQGAAVAGAAIVGFGVTAVKQFTDTAIAAGQFADATDMSVQQSSRWLDVVSRYGIELGDLSDVFNNVAGKVAEGDEVFDELGVTIARTRSGAVDMNETMTRVIEQMENVEDPAERARIAAELFGEEGSRQFAELIAKGGDLRDMFDDVADAKIIDDGEVEKARQAREDMKRLTDSLSELALEVGEAVLPAVDLLADAFEGLNTIFGALQVDRVLGFLADLDTNAERVGRKLRGLFDDRSAENWAAVDAFDRAEEAAAEFDRSLLNQASTVEQANEIIAGYTSTLDGTKVNLDQVSNLLRVEFAEGLNEAADATRRAELETTLASEAMRDEARAANRTATVLGRLERDTEDLADETEDLTDEVSEAERAFSSFLGQLSNREAWRNAQDAVAGYRAEVAEAKRQQEAGEISAEQYQDVVDRAFENMALDAARYVDSLEEVPDELKTEFIAAVRQGDVEAIERELAELTRTREIILQYRTEGSTSVPVQPNPSGPRHTGGRTSAGQPVGILAGETFIPDQAGRVRSVEDTAADAAASGMTVNFTINGATDPKMVATEVDRRLRQLLQSIRAGRR